MRAYLSIAAFLCLSLTAVVASARGPGDVQFHARDSFVERQAVRPHVTREHFTRPQFIREHFARPEVRMNRVPDRGIDRMRPGDDTMSQRPQGGSSATPGRLAPSFANSVQKKRVTVQQVQRLEPKGAMPIKNTRIRIRMAESGANKQTVRAYTVPQASPPIKNTRIRLHMAEAGAGKPKAHAYTVPQASPPIKNTRIRLHMAESGTTSKLRGYTVPKASAPIKNTRIRIHMAESGKVQQERAGAAQDSPSSRVMRESACSQLGQACPHSRRLPPRDSDSR